MRSRESSLRTLGLSTRGRSSFLAMIVATSLVPSAASAQSGRGAAPTPPPSTGSQRLELCPCPAQDVVLEGDDRAAVRQRDPQTPTGEAPRIGVGVPQGEPLPSRDVILEVLRGRAGATGVSPRIGVGPAQGEPIPNRDIVLEEDYGLAVRQRDPQTPTPDAGQRIQGEPIPGRDIVLEEDYGRAVRQRDPQTLTPDGGQRIQGEPIPNRDVVIQGEGGRLAAPASTGEPSPDRRRRD